MIAAPRSSRQAAVIYLQALISFLVLASWLVGNSPNDLPVTSSSFLSPLAMKKEFTLGKQGHRYPDNETAVVLPMVLAVYFPQFHRDPLNDRLWGEGFTDWFNLREAPRRNRKGYKIPRPSDFGYYDLRNETIRMLQGHLAKEYGVDGFVYHHYWFYDVDYPGPSLHRPLELMLEDGHPDISFCLHWVAENWTSTWHRKRDGEKTEDANGEDDEDDTDEEPSKRLLQQQFFPPTDDRRIIHHYQWLRKFFRHPNYILVDGKPLLMVYRNQPGIHHVIARLKELAIQDGFPGIHCTLGMYSSHRVLFPMGVELGKSEALDGENSVFDRLTNYPYPFDWTRREKLKVPLWCLHRQAEGEPRANEIIGIVTAFDNTPRREVEKARLWITLEGEKGIVKHFSLNLWAAIYYHACCFAGGGKNMFILINAWNEWAEGMIMEPSDVYGLTFLHSIRWMKRRFRSCAASLNKTVASEAGGILLPKTTTRLQTGQKLIDGK